jgi:hypothetical protein
MTSTRIIDNLRRVEIFAGLIDEELLKVADLCKAVRVPADRTIFSAARSATVVAIDATRLIVIREPEFRLLCCLWYFHSTAKWRRGLSGPGVHCRLKLVRWPRTPAPLG